MKMSLSIIRKATESVFKKLKLYSSLRFHADRRPVTDGILYPLWARTYTVSILCDRHRSLSNKGNPLRPNRILFSVGMPKEDSIAELVFTNGNKTGTDDFNLVYYWRKRLYFCLKRSCTTSK